MEKEEKSLFTLLEDLPERGRAREREKKCEVTVGDREKKVDSKLQRLAQRYLYVSEFVSVFD